MSDEPKEQRHWLTNTVNIGQLLIASLTLATVFVAALIYNDRRLTTLEVARDFGTTSTKTQDDELERLRVVAGINQAAIVAVNVKLDIVLSRQDAVIAALNRMTSPGK
jgi:hypothetical protein